MAAAARVDVSQSSGRPHSGSFSPISLHRLVGDIIEILFISLLLNYWDWIQTSSPLMFDLYLMCFLFTRLNFHKTTFEAKGALTLKPSMSPNMLHIKWISCLTSVILYYNLTCNTLTPHLCYCNYKYIKVTFACFLLLMFALMENNPLCVEAVADEKFQRILNNSI